MFTHYPNLALRSLKRNRTLTCHASNVSPVVATRAA